MPNRLRQSPKRLRRSESFFGLHFDFHAKDDCNEVGKALTPAMIEKLIREVRPDFLQVDCKGHPGVSSYPTKVGYPAPGFVGDPLRLWREVTAKHGVALYVHYSGVIDDKAILEPGWSALRPDGTRYQRSTSVFSSYTDKRLIPQLREIADYGVDGVWVDGDCWGAVADWSKPAQKAFREATGMQTVPTKPSDPNWSRFLEFHREAYRRYLRHYVTEVKRTHPRFQICSNWAFSDHMPEPVSAPVDFLSGDFDPENSINSGRLAGRYLAQQGKTWDLMDWSFATKPSWQNKPVPQLQREAAIVLTLGGGFQGYFKQKRDASIYEEQIPTMAELAKFCRARQALCHKAKPVPQIGVIVSTAAHYRRQEGGLFNRRNLPVAGVLQALVESQQVVELVSEKSLEKRMREYPLLVVPEWEYLEPGFREALARYVQGGGSLLLIGPKSAALFGKELGITFTGAVSPERPQTLTDGGISTSFRGIGQRVVLPPSATALGTLQDLGPAASITRFGKGKLAATYFTFSQSYTTAPEAGLRGFLSSLVHTLHPEPIVTLESPVEVDVCLARKDGKLLVHLINTSGEHRTVSITKSITPTRSFDVQIRTPRRPRKLTLEPTGAPLRFNYEKGVVRVQVPSIAIQETIVVE